MTQQYEDITLSKPVLETVTTAKEFCYYFDDIDSKSIEGILNFIHRILPLLYLKGTFLPDIDVEYPEANERFVTPEQWEELFYALRDKFGKKDEYYIIDPQYINETEPLKASLSENIADIYQDMKDFVTLFAKNTHAHRQNAVYEFKLLFQTHWGYRVGNLISKIHHMLYENIGEPPEYQNTIDYL
jgi:hypothetical protein